MTFGSNEPCSWDDYQSLTDENESLRADLAKYKELANLTEMKMLRAFEVALGVEDALGWSTGKAIRDAYFRPDKETL